MKNVRAISVKITVFFEVPLLTVNGLAFRPMSSPFRLVFRQQLTTLFYWLSFKWQADRVEPQGALKSPNDLFRISKTDLLNSIEPR